MAQEFSLSKLIQKISSQLPQIQVRSLNNIYTKIAHQIVSVEALLEYPQLPGVLMRWINDNKKKSDTLLKVIYLLASFTKLDKGLLLLRQYECLEFCEEFKIYLIQNQRAVDAFTQQLDLIIRSLLPLGRANQSHVIAIQHNQQINQGNNKNIKHLNTESKQSATATNKIQIKQVIKFVCQNIPLSESQDKTIFELIMKMKYTNKVASFATLMQIKRFVSHYADYTFRSKSDLITYLCEIGLANIFPQICMSIVGDIIKGLVNSQFAAHSQQSNNAVSLAYTKATPISIIELQIGLPLKIFQLSQSFVVIQQLVRLLKQKYNIKYQPLQYLLAINYKFSPQFLLQILAQLKQNQMIQNMSLYMKTVQEYSHRFPSKTDDFINVLPEQVWRKAQSLVSAYDSSEKKVSYRYIQNYLDPREFEVTKNLHIMMQIIDNMKKGVTGVQLSAKQAVRFYIDVVLTLAISVSRQDPLMSYYSQAQTLLLSLASRGNKQVACEVYSQLLQGIKNGKSIINYPGVAVRRHEVIEIIFTTAQFVSRLLQSSLDTNQTLNLMLNIVITLIQRNMTKVFIIYAPIFFSLTHHLNQHISSLATRVLTSMPKNTTKHILFYDLFSNDANKRRSIHAQLLGSKQEIGNGIIQKIMMGHFLNKKKELKISAESIENYLNIVLNPNLDIYIKDTALSQFIDCLQRVQGSQLPDLVEAQMVIVEQIKEIIKKEIMTNMEEKLITLHFILSQKKQCLESVLSWEMLGILLSKVKSQSCTAYILTTLYTKLFQSPFTKESNTKNWAMMHFPHLQLVKMNIELPLRLDAQQNNQKQQNQGTIINAIKQNNKYKDSFEEKYVELIKKGCIQNQISEERAQGMQDQIISAVTTTDIAKLSKLQFILANSVFKVHKPAFKIILQYVRTNQAASQIADLLSTFVWHSEDRQQFVINASSLSLQLVALNNKLISNQEVNKMMKLAQSAIDLWQVHFTLAIQNAVKFSSLNEYTGLQLIQSIVNTVRNSTAEQKSRLMCFILLNRLMQSQFKIQQHAITVQTLLTTFLMQSKVSTLQFAVVLNCYSGLLTHNHISSSKMMFNRPATHLIQQLCSLICKESSNLEDRVVVLAACFSFINDLLRHEAVHASSLSSPKQCSKIAQLIANQPNNMLVLAVSLILPNVAHYSQITCTFITQIYTFLHLLVSALPQSQSMLLNSTDILNLSLNLLVPITSAPQLSTPIKLNLLNSIARVLHKLSHSIDEFIFKLNKCIRHDNMDNAEYKLHYTLMAPLLLFKQYYNSNNININININNSIQNTKSHKIYQHSYIQMLCWLLFIWKQTTNILEQVDFIQPLVQCVLNIKQIKILRLLLCKSSIAQNLSLANVYVTEKYKLWTKSAQQLIYYYNNNNNKKSKGNADTADKQIISIQQGLQFTCALLSNTKQIKDENSQNAIQKETLWNVTKFIDQVYHILQCGQQKQRSLRDKWRAAIKCMFTNQACGKTISACVNEGNFGTINKLVGKIINSIGNLTEVADQLQLLGALSCNESVRSLIVKNRMIEGLLNGLIAMDENKVAKINCGLVYCSASFLFLLSAFKETNAKMLNDKRIMDIWAKILSLQQSEVVDEKVLQLLTNLSCFKHSKPAFMASKQIHKVCLGLLSDPQYSHKRSVLCVLYNLLYKNAAAIKMYKRKEVHQLLIQLVQVEELQDMANALLEVINNQD